MNTLMCELCATVYPTSVLFTRRATYYQAVATSSFTGTE